jgi:hypothetical protein
VIFTVQQQINRPPGELHFGLDLPSLVATQNAERTKDQVRLGIGLQLRLRGVIGIIEPNEHTTGGGVLSVSSRSNYNEGKNNQPQPGDFHSDILQRNAATIRVNRLIGKSLTGLSLGINRIPRTG